MTKMKMLGAPTRCNEWRGTLLLIAIVVGILACKYSFVVFPKIPLEKFTISRFGWYTF